MAKKIPQLHRVIQDDCLSALRKMGEGCVDLIVTDPPYGISFMGKEWDKALPSVDVWRECLRALKPGAFAFVMSIPRSDCLWRMMRDLEEAGFKVNFTPIFWTYATGFPKAGNTAKKIKKVCDNWLSETSNIVEWTNELNIVNIVESRFPKSEIGHGIHISRSDFAVENVLEHAGQRRLLCNVNIAKHKWSEVLHTSKNISIVVEHVEQPQLTSISRVITVESRQSKNKAKRHSSICFVHVNVPDYLCKNHPNRIKDGGVQKTEHGSALSWRRMGMRASFVEVIGNLKHTILSQFKLIQNLDTTSPMELPTAINVIITKSTMECLITNMADTVGKNAKHAIANLDGSYGGFQPKPAVEVIIVAMKPLSEKTFVDQALENGKGITWLDDCRVPFKNDEDFKRADGVTQGNDFEPTSYNPRTEPSKFSASSQGRFPANLIVSDDVLNDGKVHKSGEAEVGSGGHGDSEFSKCRSGGRVVSCFADSGSFSRYFDLDAWWAKTFPFLITPKPPKTEKWFWCKICKKADFKQAFHYEHIYWCEDCKRNVWKDAVDKCRKVGHTVVGNLIYHPTQKPIKLMSYLITMGSRENDLVVDPFAGTGTVGVAAVLLKRRSISIDMDKPSCEIARAKIKATLDSMER